MTDHFNGLTPAQAERLAMLAEEAGEIVQIVGKILRHGYDSYHPNDPYNNNKALLEKELADFAAVETMLEQDGVAATLFDRDQAVAKKLRYTHHQNP
jgi:NTP pyrophosphatase (non-canonical NTP hydrolase)